jgi:citrate lyase beta subunit
MATTTNARTVANAHKYANAPRAVATKAVAYTLTAYGLATATTAAGKSGKPTVMALVAVAANVATARNGGQPATGQQIVAAMRANAFVVAAYANTKAGKYAPAGTLPCPAWCSGYVAGAARNGLLAAVK